MPHSHPLHEAISQRDHKSLQDGIGKFPKEIESLDQRGNTPLCLAATKNDQKSIEILLDAGANPKSIGRQGYTPLHLVCSDDTNLQAVKKLVDCGAEIDAQTPYQHTPLHESVCDGCAVLADFLLSRGANPNALDNESDSPLHLAIDAETTRILIRHGANPNAVSSYGYTPLYNAVNCNQIERAKVLLYNGADPNADFPHHQKPLHIATSECSGISMMKLLLDCSADINGTDEDGNTPLHYAVESEQFHKINLLVLQGADCNKRNAKGQTPKDLVGPNYISELEQQLRVLNRLMQS